MRIHTIYSFLCVTMICYLISCDTLPTVFQEPKAQYVIDTIKVINSFQTPFSVVTSYNFIDDNGTIGNFYKSNRDKIKEAYIYSIAYSIDSIAFDPLRDSLYISNQQLFKQLEFDSINIFIQVKDELTKEWKVPVQCASFDNIKVSNFYRTPQLVVLPDSLSKSLGSDLRLNPEIRIMKKISKPNKTSGYFKHFGSRIQIAIGFTLNY
jgi:hypothetical protein